MKRITAIACTVFLVLTMGAVLGCGGSEGSGRTPSEVVDAYMRATIDRDVDTAYDLMSEDDRKLITKEQMKEMAGGGLEGLDISYTIGEEIIDGDTASVEVSLTVTDKETGESDEGTDRLNLVKESGEWKISLGDGL